MTSQVISWVDAAGTAHPIPAAVTGVAGLGMAAVRNQLDPIAGGVGSRFVKAALQPRKISVPLVLVSGVDSTDEGNLLATVRNWATWLNPLNGPGYIKVDTVAGDSRRIPAIYSSGLEGLIDQTTYTEPTLVFECPDPAFQDVTAQSQTWTTGPGLFSSLVNNITIGGDLDVWPQIKVTAPSGTLNGTYLYATFVVNGSLVAQLGWSGTPSGGHNYPALGSTSYTITTDWPTRDAIDNAGASSWSTMDFKQTYKFKASTPTRVDWAGGGFVAGTTITLSWVRRWLHA